ncbi:hypothetical protein Bbelb_361990 [Branchiostoma belcheri]|nr:hypothetical protein Bbelb_361990 [Branchiostoma belcheri]
MEELCRAEGCTSNLHGGCSCSPFSFVLGQALCRYVTRSNITTADIQMVPRPGARMGNMYAPIGWEIRHKYKYWNDRDDDEGSSDKEATAYTYPAGLGPVLMNGCFRTGYEEGDPCYKAKIPRTGCPKRGLASGCPIQRIRKSPNRPMVLTSNWMNLAITSLSEYLSEDEIATKRPLSSSPSESEDSNTTRRPDKSYGKKIKKEAGKTAKGTGKVSPFSGNREVSYKTKSAPAPRKRGREGRCDLETDELESIWCEITKANTSLLINCTYRPPSADDTFFDSFEGQVRLATNQTQSIKVIIGDFNAKNSNWLASNTTDNPGRQLENLFLNHGLEQVLHEPTRGGNLLDLIATSHPAKCYQTGTLAPLGDSDHLITATALTIQASQYSGKRLVWLYDKADIEALHQDIATAPWDINLIFDSMDDIWDSWYSMFIVICERHIPHKVISTTRTAKPWIYSNKQIRAAIRRKHRLHSRAKRLNTEDAWATYRRQRNIVTNLTRRAETVYIEDLVNDVETGNTRRFFTYAKSALGKTSTGIPALQVDSVILETPEAKANALNDFLIKQTDLPGISDPTPTFQPTTVPESVLDSPTTAHLASRKVRWSRQDHSEAITPSCRPKISSSNSSVQQISPSWPSSYRMEKG